MTAHGLRVASAELMLPAVPVTVGSSGTPSGTPSRGSVPFEFGHETPTVASRLLDQSRLLQMAPRATTPDG